MVNSHYVPQLILRHFSENEKIKYCDFDRKKCEIRSIKSVFSEKGYYPDEIEQELCYKIEAKFANLLNNKILKERYKVVLSKDELFILKKYLIITTIRYNITETMKKNNNCEQWISGYSESFYDNISKILACETIDQMFSYLDFSAVSKKLMNDENYGEMKLFSDIKNIIHSYIAIVSANRCKEEFIIPDIGFAYKATHLAMFSDGKFDKCMYTLNYAMQTQNPHLMHVSQLLSPYDYIFCPMSKDLGIVSFSIFYKFFNNKSDIYGLLPINGLKLSELLGFGDSDIVGPPKVKQQSGKSVSYEYEIKMLSKDDIRYLNAMMINISEHHFGYCNLDRIRSSIEYYIGLPVNERRYDIRFLLK